MPSDVVKETLELASTRDILDELDKRHSSTVFVGKPLCEDGVVTEHSSGSDSMCMGRAICSRWNRRGIKRGCLGR